MMYSHLHSGIIKNLSMTRTRVISNMPHNESTLAKYQIAPTNNRNVQTIYKPKLLKQQLMSHLPILIKDLTDSEEYAEIPEASQRLRKVLEYHLGKGKLLRMYALVVAYRLMETPQNITVESIRLVNILAWCIEMFEANACIFDDIMDASDIRRGLPCWHTLDGIGLTAVNDSMMFYVAMYFILRKYFSNHKCYLQILNLFNDVSLKAAFGQSMDNMSIVKGKPNLEIFSMTRYNAMTKFKTSYYTCFLPLALAVYFTGQTEPTLLKGIEEISITLGILFQSQDDVFDCFGDAKNMRKPKYVDIRQGKCSWLVAKALEKATNAQKGILEDCYGKSDGKCIIAVRNLYEELELQNEFKIYEKRTLKQLSEQFRQISADFPYELFTMFEQMYWQQYKIRTV